MMKWTMDNIRAFRKQQGWTQEDLAMELNTSKKRISMWECGVVSPRRQVREALDDLYAYHQRKAAEEET